MRVGGKEGRVLEMCVAWHAGVVKPWSRSTFVYLSGMILFLLCYERLREEESVDEIVSLDSLLYGL